MRLPVARGCARRGRKSWRCGDPVEGGGFSPGCRHGLLREGPRARSRSECARRAHGLASGRCSWEGLSLWGTHGHSGLGLAGTSATHRAVAGEHRASERIDRWALHHRGLRLGLRRRCGLGSGGRGGWLQRCRWSHVRRLGGIRRRGRGSHGARRGWRNAQHRSLQARTHRSWGGCQPWSSARTRYAGRSVHHEHRALELGRGRTLQVEAALLAAAGLVVILCPTVRAKHSDLTSGSWRQSRCSAYTPNSAGLNPVHRRMQQAELGLVRG